MDAEANTDVEKASMQMKDTSESKEKQDEFLEVLIEMTEKDAKKQNINFKELRDDYLDEE